MTPVVINNVYHQKTTFVSRHRILWKYHRDSSNLLILQQTQKEIHMDEIESNILDSQTVELDTESDEIQQKLFSMVKDLDEKYADVLMLKFYYDMTDKDIAGLLHLSVENVKIRIHRGKAMLRQKLTEEGYDRETV